MLVLRRSRVQEALTHPILIGDGLHDFLGGLSIAGVFLHGHANVWRNGWWLTTGRAHVAADAVRSLPKPHTAAVFVVATGRPVREKYGMDKGRRASP